MLSIIVPVYNAGPHLAPCLESILAQTYGDWELILVDDGSTDDSGPLCYALAVSDRRVVYVRTANHGESAARNRGLALAHGEFVTFIDNDDWLEPTMYATMLGAMTADVDVVMCNAVVHKREGDYPMAPTDAPAEYSGEKFLHMILSRDSDLSASAMHVNWNKIYRREVIGDARFMEDVCIGGDFAFNVQVLRRCRRVAYLPQVLYHYRHVDNGFSLKPLGERHLTEFLLYPRLQELLADRPELVDLVYTEEAWRIVEQMGTASHDPDDPEERLYAKDLPMFTKLHRLAAQCPNFLNRLDTTRRRLYQYMRREYAKKD